MTRSRVTTSRRRAVEIITMLMISPSTPTAIRIQPMVAHSTVALPTVESSTTPNAGIAPAASGSSSLTCVRATVRCRNDLRLGGRVRKLRPIACKAARRRPATRGGRSRCSSDYRRLADLAGRRPAGFSLSAAHGREDSAPVSPHPPQDGQHDGRAQKSQEQPHEHTIPPTARQKPSTVPRTVSALSKAGGRLASVQDPIDARRYVDQCTTGSAGLTGCR